MKGKKIVIAVVIVLAVVSLSYFAVKGFGSGFSNYGRELGEVIASKDNPVVATVNGMPIYLSDVALPYFSQAVSYTRSKPELMDYINSPGTSEAEKERAKETLFDVPDPESVMDRVINIALIDQYVLKKGVRIPASDIAEQAKKAETAVNNSGGMWKKYQSELIKSLGISESEYYSKYYTRMLKQLYLWNTFEKSLKVPQFTESEIKKEMAQTHGNRDVAIAILRSSYLEKQTELKADALRETANIKIVNSDVVKDLKSYFSNLYAAKP